MMLLFAAVVISGLLTVLLGAGLEYNKHAKKGR